MTEASCLSVGTSELNTTHQDRELSLRTSFDSGCLTCLGLLSLQLSPASHRTLRLLAAELAHFFLPSDRTSTRTRLPSRSCHSNLLFIFPPLSGVLGTPYTSLVRCRNTLLSQTISAKCVVNLEMRLCS